MQATAPLFPGPVSQRKQHAVELLVFLLLVVPGLAASLVVTEGRHLSFVVVAVATALRDVALVALVLYFLWRNGERRGEIGWTGRRLFRELGLGLLLFPAATLTAAAVVAALHAVGLPAEEGAPAALVPTGAGETVLALALVIVVAIAEETIFRGYLLGRIREVTRSTALAVVASTAIFVLGHGYEGAAGMIGVGVLGLVFALVYLWRKSLVAAMTMHFCQDLFAIVLMPHLASLPH